MKKIIAAALLIFSMLTILLFVGCNNPQKNPENDTEATQAKQGNASSYGEQNRVKTFTGSISEDLLLKQPVEKIKYLKGIHTGSPTEPEYNTEEVKAKRIQNAQRYLDELGIKDKIDFTIDEQNSVVFTLENNLIKANEHSVNVTPPSVPFDITATEEEVINFLKSNKYLSVLSAFSGIDLDNAFFTVIDAGCPLEELKESDDKDERYMDRTFCLCSKADSPEQLAFNLAFNSIKFWIFATKDSLNKHDVFFIAKWTEDKYIAEVNIDPSYFAVAKKQADDSIELALPSKEYKIGDKDKAKYSIYYDSSIKDNYAIPCYKFYYPTNDPNLVVEKTVPCMDISTLE